MSEQDIDYESLTQDALRGVVRTVLARVSQAERLPGKHHFYISFDTRAEGVAISKRLRDQYPEEMTIVLQHRYWDLHVHDDRFEVKLTFNSIPERLVVPFKALKVFFDPSVQFGLPFERPETAAVRNGPALVPGAADAESATDVPSDGALDTAERAGDDGAADAAPAKKSKPPVAVMQSGQKLPKPVGPAPKAEGEPIERPGGAQVVSLDAFRKK